MLGTFPQEIYEEVIQHLRDDPIALCAMALTCSSLLAASQKQLFSRVFLYPSLPKKSATSSQFKRLLSHSPHIGVYVDYLQLRMCPGRCQWTGWTTSLEYCLTHLPQLKALVLRVDQSPRLSGGFTVHPAEDHEGAHRIIQALIYIVQLPSLVYLDTYCFDISSLLHQCRHIKELNLWKLISAHISIGNSAQAQLRDCDLVFLETLRLEIYFESRDTMVWPMLHSHGISLCKLKRLSMASCGFIHDLLMRELSGILEECGSTLEVLEIQARFPANDLNSLDWTKINLPSLRVLNLHLNRYDTSSTPEDLRLFITTLTSLLCRLPCSPRPLPYSESYAADSAARICFNDTSCRASPSSRLEHLILIDHNLGQKHVHYGDWEPGITHVLSDRTRFPTFKKLSWYTCCSVWDCFRNYTFADMNDTLPFEVELGIGRRQVVYLGTGNID